MIDVLIEIEREMRRRQPDNVVHPNIVKATIPRLRERDQRR